MYKNDEQKRAYARQHYLDNRDRYKAQTAASNRRRVWRNRIQLMWYLAAHPCVDCGNSDLRVLDFDHVRGTKFKGVAIMANSSYSWNKIEEEIAKCDVVCRNCHAKRTAERHGAWTRSAFQWLINLPLEDVKEIMSSSGEEAWVIVSLLDKATGKHQDYTIMPESRAAELAPGEELIDWTALMELIEANGGLDRLLEKEGLSDNQEEEECAA